MMIVNGTSDDFTGTGAVSVNQQHERSGPVIGICMSVIGGVLILDSTTSRHDDTMSHEAVKDFDSRVEKSTGIASDVPDQCFHSFAFQFEHGGIEFFNGVLLEPGHLDIADMVCLIDDLDHRNAFDFHSTSNERRRTRFGRDGVFKRQANPAVGLTLKEGSGFFCGEFAAIASIDFDDEVTGLGSPFRSWAFGQDVDEKQAFARFRFHLDSDANEFTIDIVIEVTEFAGCEVATVIVERIASAKHELQHDGTGSEVQFTLCQVAQFHYDSPSSFRSVCVLVPVLIAKRFADLSDAIAISIGKVSLQEFFVIESEIEAFGSVSDEVCRTHGVNVIMANFVKDVVKIQHRFRPRHRQHRSREGLIRVAPFDGKVDFRLPKPLFQRFAVGKSLQ